MDAGRRLAGRSALAGRLAAPRGGPLRGGARDGRHRSRGRPCPLALGPRDPLPDAPRVAGAGRPARRVRGSPLRLRSGHALRGGDGAGTAAGARCLRARAPQQRPGHALVQPGRDGDAAAPRGTEAALGLLDGRLRRRPVHPVPRRHQRHARPTARAAISSMPPRATTSAATPPAGTLVLDFNFATQPSCAFDPRWACPLAPPENRLDLEIRAGERLA